jgi:hypothetical protein
MAKTVSFLRIIPGNLTTLETKNNIGVMIDEEIYQRFF